MLHRREFRIDMAAGCMKRTPCLFTSVSSHSPLRLHLKVLLSLYVDERPADRISDTECMLLSSSLRSIT